MKQSIRYHFLSFLSFLLSFTGVIGIRLIILAIGVGIGLATEEHIGKFGMTLGWIIGLFVGCILMIGLQRLYPYLEKFEEHVKSFKTYPYTEKYGINYPKPKPEDFGITSAEFQNYNKRFQFELIRLFCTYGLWIASCVFTMQQRMQQTPAIIFLGSAGIIAIILDRLFSYLNRKISKSHRYYEKIHRYQEAYDIYRKINKENSMI